MQLKTKRTRQRERTRALIDALHSVADTLRSGASLRHALIEAADIPGSPFSTVAAALSEGRPIGPVLQAAAADGDGAHDPDIASAFCVLAVHAAAGGDPLPACRALADRLGRRATARDEARALTTQARLGARAILLLTPAFLFIVAMSDPRGAVRWFAEPATRLAIVLGLFLQGVGALWVRAIVHGVAPGSNVLSRLPVVRAVRAIVAGRMRSAIDAEVAECAELVALALDAGLSTTAAVAAVAPYVRGTFGDVLRHALADHGRPSHDAISDAASELESEAVNRFIRAIASGAALGVPVAEAMRALASDLDERASLHLAEDVRRASIRVLVPLGVFVLPAFVLACLVPLFVGGLQGIAG